MYIEKQIYIYKYLNYPDETRCLIHYVDCNGVISNREPVKLVDPQGNHIREGQSKKHHRNRPETREFTNSFYLYTIYKAKGRNHISMYTTLLSVLCIEKTGCFPCCLWVILSAAMNTTNSGTSREVWHPKRRDIKNLNVIFHFWLNKMEKNIFQLQLGFNDSTGSQNFQSGKDETRGDSDSSSWTNFVQLDGGKAWHDPMFQWWQHCHNQQVPEVLQLWESVVVTGGGIFQQKHMGKVVDWIYSQKNVTPVLFV